MPGTAATLLTGVRVRTAVYYLFCLGGHHPYMYQWDDACPTMFFAYMTSRLMFSYDMTEEVSNGSQRSCG